METWILHSKTTSGSSASWVTPSKPHWTACKSRTPATRKTSNGSESRGCGVFGLPSFESIIINVGKMIYSGPVGAAISGSHDIDKSAAALASGFVDYVAKAQNMVSATKIVGDKVEIVKSAVEVTKANVQPQPQTGWASTVAGWIPGPTWKMDRNRTDAAELATYTVLEKV